VKDRRVDAVFAALADPTRRAVLRAVASAGSVTATELSSQFPVTRQAVAKHLGALNDAGLVEAIRHGRETRYNLRAAPLNDALDWITGVGEDWDDRLKSLHTYLKSRQR
jgi:DNA-binding transcriptional ArsR family regulator